MTTKERQRVVRDRASGFSGFRRARLAPVERGILALGVALANRLSAFEFLALGTVDRLARFVRLAFDLAGFGEFLARLVIAARAAPAAFPFVAPTATRLLATT